MAPRTDRLTWMLAVCALALLLAASPAHGRDLLEDAVAAAEDDASTGAAEAAGYKQSTGGLALSKYNPSTKRYLPVATDPLYSYYRINITWQVVITGFWDPDPSTPTLWQAVISSPVFDGPSGEKIGSVDATSILTGPATAGNGAPLVSEVFYGVYELGPQGDDAIMNQGSSNYFRGPPTGPGVPDGDNALVGGTGQFLGATGQSLEKYAKYLADGSVIEVFEFAVPRFKSF